MRRGGLGHAVHLYPPLLGAQRAGSSGPSQGREVGSFSLSELPREEEAGEKLLFLGL